MNSLIEGIGDEVLGIFCLLFLVLLLSLAWISTHVNDAPPISIIVLDRRRWNQLLERLRNTSATIIRIPVAQHIRQHLQRGAQPQVDTGPDPPNEPPETTTSTEPSAQESPVIVDTDISTPQGRNTRTNLGESESQDRPMSEIPQPQPTASQSVNDQPPDPLTTSIETESSTTETGQPTEEEWQERSSEGFIRVRVKYLDDRQRLLYAKPDTTIGQLKRDHFGQELSDNMAVRIVYQGQELRTEGATLQGCNITDNSVIHIVLTRARQAPDPGQSLGNRPQQFDPSNMMMPLFATILGLVWYCRFAYRAYFSVLSTICLTGITLLFGLVAYATVRVQQHRGREHVD